MYGRLDMIEVLVKSRADPNIDNINGMTALSIAKVKEQKSLVELMKKYENINKTSKIRKV